MNKKTKKIFALVLTTMMLSALLLNGCGKEEKKESYVLKIGTANGSLCLAPLHVAQDLGYFEEEFNAAGIKYELVEIDMQ